MNSNNEEEEFYWTEVKVKLLLTLYLANIDDFRNTSNKKRDVWQKIANELECAVDACDKKFRNLKCYYVNLLRRNRAQTTSTWPYFQILQEIFENDSTLQINKVNSNVDSNDDDDEAVSDCSSDDTSINTETNRGLKRPHLENDTGNNTGKFRKMLVNRTFDTITTLDKLITQIDVSNKIQRERNKLFQKYYSIISHTQGLGR